MKIKRRCVEMRLLSFKTLSDWRAAFEAGRWSRCTTATVKLRIAVVIEVIHLTTPTYWCEGAQDARNDTFAVLKL